MMNLSILTIVILIGGNLLAGPSLNRIVGENDLVLVNAQATNIPFKYRPFINAVGLLSNSCTGTHIGGGYVLTAAHCFFAGAALKRDLNCSEVRIEWGVRDGLTPYMVSACEKIIAIQLNHQVDFAVLKVSPVPKAAIAIDITNAPLPGDTLTIFSHPEQLPLHWSKTCVVDDSGHAKLPPDSLKHTCDTKQGSSGALMLSTTSLSAIGIHGGGIIDATGSLNYGTPLSRPEIADILKELGFK